MKKKASKKRVLCPRCPGNDWVRPSRLCWHDLFSRLSCLQAALRFHQSSLVVVQPYTEERYAMFLMGLKFALGLWVGLGSLLTLAICIGAFIGSVFQGSKERKKADQRLVSQAELAIAHRSKVLQSKVLVVLRYPSWIDEPKESTHRKSEFTQ